MAGEPELKSYEVRNRVLLPGNTKVTEYPIIVSEAKDLEDAITRAEEIWVLATQMKDVSVKEIPKVIKPEEQHVQ